MKKPCQLGNGRFLIDDLKILPSEVLRCALEFFFGLPFAHDIRLGSIAYPKDIRESIDACISVKRKNLSGCAWV